MTTREDIAIIRERLECARKGATEDALTALDRIEATLPKPTIQEQFLELEVGTHFRVGSQGTPYATFIKTGDTAVVQLITGTERAKYYGDMFNKGYEHWTHFDHKVERI